MDAFLTGRHRKSTARGSLDFSSHRNSIVEHEKNTYLCAVFFVLTVFYAFATKKSGCLEREKALALLETVQQFLSKAEDSYLTCNDDLNTTDDSKCSREKPLAYIQISKKIISDVRENFPTCEDSKVIVPDVTPRDCATIFASGHNKSGVYTIWLSESNTTAKQLQVYCDMETSGGGWTVFQRRGKFKVQQDFYQDWESYKNGFGNLTEEFWLGNENIRLLCRSGCEIRFDLKDKNGMKGFAVYKNFTLSEENYLISISGYSGDVGDTMKFHDDFPFSTKDQDTSGRTKELHGGWWYNQNTYCSLNGIYQPGKSGYNGIVWYYWRAETCLASVEIKVKPK